jgi:argininosuccinate lyase
MKLAASHDLMLATEVADAIAARGIPFRTAHDIVSVRIGEAIRSGKTLRQLGPNEQITDIDLAALDVDRALTRRNTLGGTAPERVKEAARRARVILSRTDGEESPAQDPEPTR